jgi:3-oxoacyl-[acyl-carrier protein] reductase
MTLRAAGATAFSVRADASDASAMRVLFDRAEAKFGPVDVLVNDAGIIQ